MSERDKRIEEIQVEFNSLSREVDNMRSAETLYMGHTTCCTHTCTCMHAGSHTLFIGLSSSVGTNIRNS